MHFDNLFVSLWEDEYEPKVNKNNLIKKRFSYIDGSRELYVVFPPWHSKLKYNFLLRNYLRERKASLLEYKFNGHFLSSNTKMTKKYFNLVKRRVAKEIVNLKREYSFSKMNLVGLSLGCVNTCMVAREIGKIEELILIVPGNSLAESLWEGIKTKKLRKNLERKSINLDKLKRSWKDLDPEENINKIKFNRLLICLSKRDVVIPYKKGKNLVKKIKKKNKLKFMENKFLGHYLTVIGFYLFPRKFLEFSSTKFLLY